MSQHFFDRVNINALIQEMGGKAVSEGMDAVAYFNACFVLGAVIDFLSSGDGHGLVFVSAEKEP